MKTPPRFLVPRAEITKPSAVLTESELHHVRVRRLAAGDAVILTDGAGTERRGTIETIGPARVTVAFDTPPTLRAEPALRLVLGQCVLKARKLDDVVERATELGATAILLIESERVQRTGATVRHDRLERIARAAAKQCQRPTVPTITGPLPLAAALTQNAALSRILFWEAAPSPTTLDALTRIPIPPAGVLLLVGPEGGFAPAEVVHARAAGAHVVGLPLPILRAETAALAAIVIAQCTWGALRAR